MKKIITTEKEIATTPVEHVEEANKTCSETNNSTAVNASTEAKNEGEHDLLKKPEQNSTVANSTSEADLEKKPDNSTSTASSHNTTGEIDLVKKPIV